MRVLDQKKVKVSGRDAFSTMLENDSPIQGQKEQDHLVTLRSGDTLLEVVFIAPESARSSYQPAFDEMLKSFKVR